MWKDLFAIPWDINKVNSEWCNTLIKKWMAKLVMSSDDILEEYNIFDIWKIKESKSIKFIDEIEKEIYNILILESLTTDELLHRIALDITTINFKLSMMEINNLIKKWLWWKYEVF
jgi:DNA processing protein